MHLNSDLLFVTGFPRSGTTWTNKLFLQCFNCGFANEIQFVLLFNKKLSRYGDLRITGNLNNLISDLLLDDYFRILKKSYRLEFSLNEVIAEIKEPTYSDIVRAILNLVSRGLGKDVVGGKCPSLGWDLDTVHRLFPKAKIIHVIRDGRDCALSHYRMAWGFRNAYVAASHWSRYVRNARLTGHRMGPEYYLEFRYEDLLIHPRDVVTRLEKFIHGTEVDQITECVMANVNSTGLSNNFDKWRAVMSLRDQGIFEAVAGEELGNCGYSLTGNQVALNTLEKWWSIIEDRCRREARYLARRILPSLSEKIG